MIIMNCFGFVRRSRTPKVILRRCDIQLYAQIPKLYQIIRNIFDLISVLFSFRIFFIRLLLLLIPSPDPSVTGEIVIPELLNQNFTVACPIEGAIRRQWLKNGVRGTVPPFGVHSSILQFELFSTGDQGYYYCEGFGGGVYRDVTVATEPALLLLKGKLGRPQRLHLCGTHGLNSNFQYVVLIPVIEVFIKGSVELYGSTVVYRFVLSTRNQRIPGSSPTQCVCP